MASPPNSSSLFRGDNRAATPFVRRRNARWCLPIRIPSANIASTAPFQTLSLSRRPSAARKATPWCASRRCAAKCGRLSLEMPYVLMLLLALQAVAPAVELKQKTSDAYASYVTAAEQQIDTELKSNDFFWGNVPAQEGKL